MHQNEKISQKETNDLAADLLICPNFLKVSIKIKVSCQILLKYFSNNGDAIRGLAILESALGYITAVHFGKSYK